MRIGILTSSRADYSLYFPLLQELDKEPGLFDVTLLAFGTHLSELHGYTLKQIQQDGWKNIIELNTLPESDQPQDISRAMAKTIAVFTDLWVKEKFDLLMALGDRYEMFAACASAVPFNIPIAHYSGGEDTFGAIDNAFRHSISHMSRYHFTSAGAYKKRVEQLTGSDEHVYNVGALSIDNLKKLPLLSIAEFKTRFGIDLSAPCILITFHPETVSFEKNEGYITELIAALTEIKNYRFIFTMPNADTTGNLVREKINAFVAGNPQAVSVESFGTVGYLSCMKHCSMLLGNTSSGFVEASFFPKRVINLGARQSGRIVTPNIINCEIERNKIIAAIHSIDEKELTGQVAIYGKGNAAAQITGILKKLV